MRSRRRSTSSSFERTPPVLEFRNVTVVRGERIALRDVSFAIRRGEHAAILGPNGSGKSTLVKCITRECYPTDGSVRIWGRRGWDVFDLRSQLGIVTPDLQAACLRDVAGLSATGYETVLSGFFSSIGLWRNHRVTKGMAREARRSLRFLGIDELADRPMAEMSSGEARRVLIARALVHKPRALVLDEPTNSLDFKAASQFLRTIDRIASSGITVILVTHHVEDIVPAIRRVLLLKGGTVVADGTVKQVLTTQNIRRVFDVSIAINRTRRGFRMIH